MAGLLGERVNRRGFLKGIGFLTGGVLLAGCGENGNVAPVVTKEAVAEKATIEIRPTQVVIIPTLTPFIRETVKPILPPEATPTSTPVPEPNLFTKDEVQSVMPKAIGGADVIRRGPKTIWDALQNIGKRPNGSTEHNDDDVMAGLWQTADQALTDGFPVKVGDNLVGHPARVLSGEVDIRRVNEGKIRNQIVGQAKAEDKVVWIGDTDQALDRWGLTVIRRTNTRKSAEGGNVIVVEDLFGFTPRVIEGKDTIAVSADPLKIGLLAPDLIKTLQDRLGNGGSDLVDFVVPRKADIIPEKLFQPDSVFSGSLKSLSSGDYKGEIMMGRFPDGDKKVFVFSMLALSGGGTQQAGYFPEFVETEKGWEQIRPEMGKISEMKVTEAGISGKILTYGEEIPCTFSLANRGSLSTNGLKIVEDVEIKGRFKGVNNGANKVDRNNLLGDLARQGIKLP